MLIALPDDPTIVGVKVTDAVAVPPFPGTLRLVAETANGTLVISVTVAAAAPAFVTVIVFAWLVCPTGTIPKSSDRGLTVMGAPAATPFPARFTTTLG